MRRQFKDADLEFAKAFNENKLFAIFFKSFLRKYIIICDAFLIQSDTVDNKFRKLKDKKDELKEENIITAIIIKNNRKKYYYYFYRYFRKNLFSSVSLL